MRQAVVRSKEDFKNISIPSEFNISLNYNQESTTMSCDGKIQMNPCHISTPPFGSFLSGVILTRADEFKSIFQFKDTMLSYIFVYKSAVFASVKIIWI